MGLLICIINGLKFLLTPEHSVPLHSVKNNVQVNEIISEGNNQHNGLSLGHSWKKEKKKKWGKYQRPELTSLTYSSSLHSVSVMICCQGLAPSLGVIADFYQFNFYRYRCHTVTNDTEHNSQRITGSHVYVYHKGSFIGNHICQTWVVSQKRGKWSTTEETEK